MSQRRILILGGAGFIGSHLAKRLISQGEAVRIYTRSSRSIKNIYDILERVDLVYGDFMDDVSLKASLKDVDTVVHLISTTFPGTTVESGIYDVFSNLVPTVRLLELCRENGVRRIIYGSSGGTVYGEPEFIPVTEEHPLRPKSMYGQSKKTIESYLHFFEIAYGLNIQILRISNPYGPRQNLYGTQGIVAVALGSVIDGRKFRVFGNGEQIRDYIFIEDVINAIVKAINMDHSATLNISSGVGVSVKEILDILERITGKKICREYIPSRVGDVLVNVLDNKKAKKIYHWQPRVSIEQGIEKTWNWIINSSS